MAPVLRRMGAALVWGGLYGVLNYATLGWSLPGAAVPVSIRPQIVIPLLVGYRLGPWAGFIAGGAGNLLGDWLCGWGLGYWPFSMGNGLMGALGGLVWLVIAVLYRPLVYLAFDETAARVSGLPTNRLNYLLAVLTALTVAVAMRIVGILLVAALMVIPVACALAGANGFRSLIVRSVAYALAAVIIGLLGAYYGNFAPGGCIVLAATGLFMLRSLPVWR